MVSPTSTSQTHASRILAELWEHPNGATDAQLTEILGLRRPQIVNSVCNRLAKQGLIARERQDGIYLNRALARELPRRSANPLLALSWSWEGNVQKTVIAFLEREGWTIARTAITATRERGKDIEAEKSGSQTLGHGEGIPGRNPADSGEYTGRTFIRGRNLRRRPLPPGRPERADRCRSPGVREISHTERTHKLASARCPLRLPLGE